MLEPFLIWQRNVSMNYSNKIKTQQITALKTKRLNKTYED